MSNIYSYSSYYFCNKPNRLAVCTLPLHALLHIANNIEAMGPVWCYWAFPMERFCGLLLRANKSWRYPYSSINRQVLQLSQLLQIKLIYGLTKELDLKDCRSNFATGTHYDGYSDLVFMEPEWFQIIQQSLVDKVVNFVSRKFKFPERLVRDELAVREFTVWGKMQQITKSNTGNIIGGDLFRGHHLSPNLNHGMRDASHAQVSF